MAQSGHADRVGECPFLYAEKRQYDRVIADYTEAIRLTPNFSSLFGRSSAYEKMGRLDEALADLRSALALDPTSQATKNFIEIIERKIAANKKGL